MVYLLHFKYIYIFIISFLLSVTLNVLNLERELIFQLLIQAGY